MSDNVVNFPKLVKQPTANDALENAKGWDFEQVIIIGITNEENGGTVIVTAEKQDKRFYLEMAELLRVMYLQLKGWK